MASINSSLIPLSAALSLLYVSAAQASDSWRYSGRASAGVEQQSNVTNRELDQASGSSDVATLLQAELTAQWQASEQLQLEGGYSIQDSNYRQADSFDTQLHLAYLDAGYQMNATTVGTNLYLARAILAGEGFLSLQQASVYAMHGASDSWFIRPALSWSEKQFDRLSARDASAFGASIDSFWFFTQGQRFISLGLMYEQEDSRDAMFSYQAPGLRLKLSGNYQLWQLDHTVQLGATLSQRRYAPATPSEAATPRREDTQTQLQVSWQLALNAHLAVLTKLQHGDFSSTLDSADYRETRSSVALQLSF